MNETQSHLVDGCGSEFLNGDGGTLAGEPNRLLQSCQAGDVVLIQGRGYEVRAVVPADKMTRVSGWVEFAGQSTSEADLIRDKKAFVRPMPKKDEKK